MNRNTRSYIAAIFGAVFITVILIVAIAIPNPSEFQYQVFRITLALAAGGAGAMIPGILNVSISKFVSAGGALAVFAVVYFYSPAQLAVRVAASTYRAPESVYVQQLESARQAFEMSRQRLEMGLVTLSDVISAHRQYVKVELSAATETKNQIAALKNALNTAKDIESVVAMNIQVGLMDPSQLPEIAQYRIEREIELAQAQSASNR